MNKNEWLKYATDCLKNSAEYSDDDEFWLRNLAAELFTGIMQNAPAEANAYAEAETENISAQFLVKLNAALNELISGRPLEQILGYTYFCGEKIKIFPNVLIPRPDSEVVLETIKSFLPFLEAHSRTADTKMNFLEIGVGSGALSIALARLLAAEKYNNYHIYASDISEAAIAASTYNINAAGFNAKISLEQADLWPSFVQANSLSQNFTNNINLNLVFSNPPYLSEDEWEQAELGAYEPREALLAGPEGLDVYARIFSEGKNLLAADTLLILEHGFKQAESLKTLAQKYGWKYLRTDCDLAQRPRVSSFVK